MSCSNFYLYAFLNANTPKLLLEGIQVYSKHKQCDRKNAIDWGIRRSPINIYGKILYCPVICAHCSCVIPVPNKFLFRWVSYDTKRLLLFEAMWEMKSEVIFKTIDNSFILGTVITTLVSNDSDIRFFIFM